MHGLDTCINTRTSGIRYLFLPRNNGIMDIHSMTAITNYFSGPFTLQYVYVINGIHIVTLFIIIVS